MTAPRAQRHRNGLGNRAAQRRKLHALLAASLVTVAAGAPALADDTELFVATSAVRPNVLLVIDNSAGMAAEVLAQDAYDPGAVYAGGCEQDRIYYRSGTGAAPDCGTDRWIEARALRCEAAAAALRARGHYVDKLVQYDPDTTTAPQDAGERWETIDPDERSRPVECRADAGRHGDGVDGEHLFACDGAACAARGWGGADTQISWRDVWNDETYTLYAGNYLNWAASPPRPRTRLAVVQDAAAALLDSLEGVNVGLMTFTDDAAAGQGGFVAHALEDVATARPAVKAKIAALTPQTFTPLTEALYEAAAYYAGRNVVFGAASSAAESRVSGDAGVYRSPIVDACQKSHVVLLTDGEPTSDEDIDSRVRELRDHSGQAFSSLVGVCDVESASPASDFAGSQCLDDLAQFLAEGDSSPLAGTQTVTTHTIGFPADLPLLADTARRGGGTYRTVNDTASLAAALTNVLLDVAGGDRTFAAPSVAANAFNRTQHLSDLFVAVFRPTGRPHWPGNLKKYRLRARDAAIVDAAGKDAVDAATGSFAAEAQSIWSPRVDGDDVLAGGTANLVPAAAARELYTYLGASAELTHASNAVTAANPALTDALLAIGGSGGDATRDDVIRFVRGEDVGSSNGNVVATGARSRMGDSLHSQPAAVVYGPRQRDGLVFVATNDGFMHALDLATGVEQWAFVPREFLTRQGLLYANARSAEKHYGIDGGLRVLAIGDGDARIEPGERVFLYFGMGRGGDFYYALDVTDAARPKLLFRLDRTTLPKLGQTWSTPTPARIEIAGADYHADNVEKRVLVLGGGYEADQDRETLSTDSSGNAIYIVDAYSGRLLWSAGNSGASQNFAAMGRSLDYSIPGAVRVVDLDGDGRADRLYAGDMGGQVWRFDVRNGQPATSLVTGGVIAQLGGAPHELPAPEAVRRFYYAPDIAFVNARTQSFIHVGIGSGHRGQPLSVTSHDRFYALRDYRIEPLSQAEFDALTPIMDAALTKIASARTAVPPGGPGWRLDLELDTGWIGEKVLAEARTFNGEVVFSTFTPSRTPGSCAPQPGTNRVYRMSVFDGSPVTNLDASVDGPNELTLRDVYVERAGSILPAAQAFFVDGDTDGDGTPDGEEDSDGDGIPDSADADSDGDTAPGSAEPVICVGLTCYLSGFPRGPVLTFWSQHGID